MVTIFSSKCLKINFEVTDDINQFIILHIVVSKVFAFHAHYLAIPLNMQAIDAARINYPDVQSTLMLSKTLPEQNCSCLWSVMDIRPE